MTGPLGPGRRHSVFHSLRVASVDRLTDDAVALTFEVPPALREEFRFRAGQHVSVRAPQIGDDTRRNYSICSPASSGVLRIGVKRIPGGTFSSFAAERLAPGDALDVMTPTGSFTADLDPARARCYGFIAAGSGITPVLSILATALEVEPGSSAVLIYVNRTAASIMFLDELADLKDRYPDRFQLVHVLDEEALDAELLSGRLDAGRLERILAGLVPAGDVDDWFLCGPLPMTEAVRAVLLARGADPARVHRELFFVGPPPALTAAPAAGDQAAGSAVTVLLDGRSQSFRLRPDGESILNATLRVRPDAPYACKNGVCGTCRARLAEGQVRLDANYALEPGELAAGFVLTCQAHPVTDRVVVDYDQ
ncbi:MAG: 1,2-phenylacetyl-CoA epoxidase subunit PaaE [Streptosporangiaceae bacterium]